VRDNGEVEWPLAEVPHAIDALANVGQVVLGLAPLGGAPTRGG
jgi:hypothetical protein